MRSLRKTLTALSPAILLVSVLCGIISAQSGLTTIQDTLFDADGARYNGTLTIQWSTFYTTNPGTIVQQSKTVQVTNGNLLVQLTPNNTATPPANIYTVLYQSDGDQLYTETWSVSASATPLKVTQVRIGTVSGGLAAGLSGGTSTVTEASVTNLVSDLNARPIKGPGFGTNAVAVVDQNGQIETAVGNAGDCVFVDGTTGPCSSVALPTFITGEVPGGTLDGNNSTFTLANAPSGTSLLLFRNGLLLQPGTDYALSGSTIQFAGTVIPQPQDALVAEYRLDSGSGGGTGSNGAGTGSGSAGVNGCGAVGTSSKSGSYTIQSTDNGYLLIETASAGFTLPSAIPAPGWCIMLLNTSSSGITVGNNGLAINGVRAGYTLKAANTISVVSDGFGYWTSGANGANGANGTNGTNGAAGATGPAGATGSAGAPGPAGATGPAGPAGSGSGGGSGAPAYVQPVSGATTLTITAATHAQGTTVAAFCFDSNTPADAVECSYTVSSAGTVAFSWGQPFSGYVQIMGSGAGPQGPVGATGPTGPGGGPAGPTGPAGAPGATGATGPAGAGSIVCKASFSALGGSISNLTMNNCITGVTYMSTGRYILTLSSPPPNWVMNCTAGATGLSWVFCSTGDSSLPVSTASTEIDVGNGGSFYDPRIVFVVIQ